MKNTIIVSIIALIISIVSISFQIGAWIKNQKNEKEKQINYLLNNVYDYYRKNEYMAMAHLDHKSIQTTFNWIFFNYLLEIEMLIKNFKYLKNNFICLSCFKEYKFNVWDDFLIKLAQEGKGHLRWGLEYKFILIKEKPKQMYFKDYKKVLKITRCPECILKSKNTIEKYQLFDQIKN